MSSHGAAWTNLWLRRLPWRHLIATKQHMEQNPYCRGGIGARRLRRVVAEWQRRKREGGGGMAAGA
jgi:hypothetical protein